MKERRHRTAELEADRPRPRRPPLPARRTGYCRCDEPMDVADDDYCWRCRLPIEGGEDDE